MTRCIWYVSKYVAPPDGPDGVGSRGYELMRELAALGHRCVIVTSDANHLATVPHVQGRRLLQKRDGLLVCWVRTLKAARAKSWQRIAGWLHFEWRLARLRKRDLPRPDVVVVSSPSLFTLLNGLWLKRRIGARLVFEVRDIWPLTLVDEGGYSPRNPLIRLLGTLERLGYRHADAVVGTMPNLREHVRTVLGQDRPVHCIPMGYSPRALKAGSVSLPESFLEEHTPSGRFTVVYAGTIGISNALETLFEVAETLRARTDIHFLVVGDGSLRQQYVDAYGSLDNLTFVPRVPKDAVGSLLARCDLLYLSTRPGELWRYGQSLNKLVDYMLAGKPILASFSGHPSMVDEARCGTFVPAGDAVAVAREVERYRDMEATERDAIGQRGREWLMTHRPYPRLASDYAEVLTGTGST
ncbi:glycosyltransferase family 4 protein [Nocardioides aequoreus]|uniref:glycosyltransferase family 4 protein n=1 Tax=Nocardioides aequoreus TaxID=397278 RepID=UPI0004C31E6E|nr:glycosyltransferase family 4 protein [Nocardioides aequoreus]